jgi:hypothetical protein
LNKRVVFDGCQWLRAQQRSRSLCRNRSRKISEAFDLRFSSPVLILRGLQVSLVAIPAHPWAVRLVHDCPSFRPPGTLNNPTKKMGNNRYIYKILHTRSIVLSLELRLSSPEMVLKRGKQTLRACYSVSEPQSFTAHGRAERTAAHGRTDRTCAETKLFRLSPVALRRS